MTQPGFGSELARELLDGITTLNGRVEALADLPSQVEELTEATKVQSKRSTRHLVLIIATIAGLCLDGGVSVLFWRQHIQQDCLSTLRAASAHIADLDRQANDLLLKQIFTQVIAVPQSVARAALVEADYTAYTATRAHDDKLRMQIGVANTKTCPLF